MESLTKKLSVITREEQPRIKKSLTKNDGYRMLLYIIGKSRGPLSSHQICNLLQSKYPIEMLKELCPKEYTKDKILFRWEEVNENLESGKYKRKLIKKFNGIFGLNWCVEENNQDQNVNDDNNNALIHFKLTKNSDKSEQLNIYHGQSNMIVIHLDPKEKNKQRNAHLYIFHIIENSPELKESYTLMAEPHENKTSIYTIKHNSTTTRYLDLTLKPKVEKIISDKIKQVTDTSSEFRKQRGDYSSPKISGIGLAEYFPDIKEMQENRENWRYSLNLRGLLLYLYHENNSIDKRKAKSRIREVISNPILKDKAKFLMFWEDFEKIGFNVFTLLWNISIEYIHQLHIDTEKDNYLIRRITERFFIELENIFHRFDNPIFTAYFIKEIGAEEYNKILEKSNGYTEMIISHRKDWIKKEQEVIDFFDKKCKTFRLKKELYNAIDASAKYGDNHIILIDKLAQKHEMSGEEMHDFINSVILRPSRQNEKRTGQRSSAHYFNYKDKQYLVVNSCLISIPKVDKLKSLLYDGMDIKDAYLILDKHNIPKSCSHELVCKLGFWVRSKNDYTGGYLVKDSGDGTADIYI